MPFGGMMESGLGREMGQEGLEAYLKSKHIALRLRDGVLRDRTPEGGEKPMIYFPPELHVQFNSKDDGVALAAHEEWERCVKRYRRRYKKIEPQLPSMLRRFHDEQCLHDADVFAPAIWESNGPWNGRELMIVAQQINTLFAEYVNTLAILRYTIIADPVIETPLASAVFNQVQPTWLYDEADLVEPGAFSHEILISDGKVIKLLFSDFTYHIAPLCKEGQTSSLAKPKKKQMASA